MPDGTYRFTAKIDVTGIRACSGVLVAPQWVATAKSCFPEGDSGTPVKAATVTVGRTDLTSTAGYVLPIVELVPRADRNLVLAKLSAPIGDILPASLATTAPAAGDLLKLAGYGRTATEWVPNRLHAADFAVQSVDGPNLRVGAADPCRGDSGGPAFREVNGQVQLVAINSASWQRGCFGETETRNGATETRLDDIAAWIKDSTKTQAFTGGQEAWRDSMWFDKAKVVSGDFNGDGKEDVAELYAWNAGQSVIHTWTNTGSGYTFNYAVWNSGVNGFVWDNAQFVAGDWNGDGKDDLAVLYAWNPNQSVIHTWTSTGIGFTFNYAPWNSGPNGFTYANAKFTAGDWNGDGKDDLAVLYKWSDTESVIHTWTSTGTGFTFNYVLWHDNNFAWANAKLLAGDWTGDGKDDLAVLYKWPDDRAVIHTWTSTGTGLTFNYVKWDSGTGGVKWDSAKPFAGDFNGDGKSDIGVICDDTKAGVQTWTSDGTGFARTKQVLWQLGPAQPVQWAWNAVVPLPSDINGDHRTDLVTLFNNGNDNASLYRFTSTD